MTRLPAIVQVAPKCRIQNTIVKLFRHHHDMRTTVTLDDDLKAKLDLEMRKSGKSFQEALNSYLRLGMDAQAHSKSVKSLVVRARPLGLSRDSPTTT